MSQASKQVRKIRRIKRERTLAYKGLDLALKQRDDARMIAGALELELKKYTDDPFPEDAPPLPTAPISDAYTGDGTEGGDNQLEAVFPKPSLTITKIEDEETEGINQSDDVDHLYDNDGNLIVGI